MPSARSILLALIPPLAAVLAFAPAIRCDYIYWDDSTYIGNSPLIRSPAAFPQIWSPGHTPQYYPLTFSSYWFEYRLFGDSPTAFHATNLLLHALAAAFAALLLRELGLPTVPACIAATLFAVAPIQTMSVAWLAERKNVLSTAFGFASMLLYARAFRTRRTATALLATLLFAAAILSKTVWLVLPLVVFSSATCIQRIPPRRALAILASTLPIALILALVTLSQEQQYADAGLPTFAQRCLIAPRALLITAAKCLVPYDLKPFYPMWNLSPDNPLTFLPAILLAALIAALYALRRRLTPLEKWSLLSFILFLLPSLGLVSFGNLSMTWISEHFAYTACLPLFAALTSLATRLSRRALLPAAILCLVFIPLTWHQISFWHDAQSFWQYAVAKDPDFYGVYLGRAAASAGRHDFLATAADLRTAQSLDRTHAIQQLTLPDFLRAMGIDPNSPPS